jgi:hypothetical protein
MKKRSQNYINDILGKINRLTRHIRNVEDNCVLLGTKLIECGDIEFGRKLIANGMIHDASKFSGIEFENLSYQEPSKEESAKLKLKMAVHHHNLTNPHHPEHWGNISMMPSVFLAEAVCDWKSRSEEFGTSLRDWIDNEATKRFGFTKEDKIYKEIMGFVDLLCEKPFENITKE